MKIFSEPNLGGNWKCPICGTYDVKPVTLIAIDGTQVGSTVQAEQYHVDCIDLEQRDFEGDLVLLMRFEDRRRS